MNSKIFLVGLLLLALSACTDVNDDFKGYDVLVDKQKEVTAQGVEYTLTDADYATVAKYEGVAKADSQVVASKKAMPTAQFAQRWLPTLLASKFYQYDNGSLMATYNLVGGLSENVMGIAEATEYELKADDYAAAWGSGTTAYLTPSTVGRIPSILGAALASAADSGFAVVSYKYSANEPGGAGSVTPTSNWAALAGGAYPAGNNWNFNSSGSIDLSAYAGQTVRLGFRYTSTTSKAGTVEFKNLHVGQQHVSPQLYAEQGDGSYKLTDKAPEANGKYVILANVNGTYHFFGKIKNRSASYGYSTGPGVTVTNGVVAKEVADTIFVELAKTDAGFTIKNADGKYLFMKGTYNNFNVSTDANAVADGKYDWTFKMNGSMVDVVNVGMTKRLQYDIQYKSFGAYPEANIKTLLSNSLLAASLPDGFEIRNVVLPAGSTYVWQTSTSYGAKATAYVGGQNLESDSWIISPEIEIPSSGAPYVMCDWAANFYTNGFSVADFFKVYVSSDYTPGADISVEGNKALKAAAPTETLYAVYRKLNSSWTVPDDVLIVTPADYASMGFANNNFSSSLKPGEYIPTFLTVKRPYAKEGDLVTVAYHFYENSATTIKADDWAFEDGAWVVKNDLTPTSEQYVRNDGAWVLDPTVTIDLPSTRNDAVSTPFYQACVDWVKENVDNTSEVTGLGGGFVTSYGNNDYYSGASAYNNNVDWRFASARNQFTKYFEDMSDAEVVSFLQGNVPKVFQAALAKLYPDNAPMQGIDTYCIVNFKAYYGIDYTSSSSSRHDWTIKFQITGKGQYEYVEGSMKSVE